MAKEAVVLPWIGFYMKKSNRKWTYLDGTIVRNPKDPRTASDFVSVDVT